MRDLSFRSGVVFLLISNSYAFSEVRGNSAFPENGILDDSRGYFCTEVSTRKNEFLCHTRDATVSITMKSAEDAACLASEFINGEREIELSIRSASSRSKGQLSYGAEDVEYIDIDGVFGRSMNLNEFIQRRKQNAKN